MYNITRNIYWCKHKQFANSFFSDNVTIKFWTIKYFLNKNQYVSVPRCLKRDFNLTDYTQLSHKFKI